MKAYLIGLLLLPSIAWNFSCKAAPSTFEEARIYYEAEDYDASENAYTQLLTTSPAPSDQAIARYGLGLSYATKKQWGDASSEFRLALALSGLQPALKRDIQIALSEVLIHQAISSSKDPALLAYALDLLAEARRIYDEAGETNCLLWKSQGGTVCPLNSYETPLLKWLNSVEAEVSVLRQESILHPASLLEALWQSQLALTSFNEDLKLLKDLQSNTGLLKKYEQKFSENVSLFYSLLENASIHVPQKMRPSYDFFRENIRQFQASIASNSLSAAENALVNSDQTMEKWMEAVFPDKADIGALLQLMAFYEMALRGKIIPENIVKSILKVFESGKIKGDPKAQSAQKYSEMALQAMQEGKPAAARIFLEAAYILTSGSILKSETPLRKASDILILAMALERNTTKLTRMLAAAQRDLSEEKSVLVDVIEPAQQEVIGLMAQFPAYALKEQRSGFKGTKEIPGRCQHKPWDRVMPLFYSAWAAADKAQGKNYIRILQHQERNLANLSEALRILLEPIAEGNDSCYTKRPPSKKPEPSPSAPEKSSPEPIENVMRQIQMMEQDDKIEKPQSVMKIGEKPW
ncbi:MAG: tetratricopeptide repeat protein [Parachlamydiales bacterium]|jgi:hypothetical protein